jgi:hypothetical protein
MTDYLALLDRAIDDLARPETSRTSRDTGSADSATGTGEVLTETGVPVLPVKKQEVWEDDAQNRAADDAKGAQLARVESTLRNTGNTGSTGSSEDLYGFDRSRGDPMRTVLTGTTGSFGDEFKALAHTLAQRTVTDGEWSTLTRNLLQSASEANRDDYEERAAIIEFDAGLPRGEAEGRAWREVFGETSRTSRDTDRDSVSDGRRHLSGVPRTGA